MSTMLSAALMSNAGLIAQRGGGEHRVERDTVTRVEIARHVETAFANGSTRRADLIAAAIATNARGALLSVLADLPDRQYAELRQLWTELAEVPIGL